MKNADEPLVASRLTRIYDVVVLATLVLIGAEVATWFIHVPAVVWLIRTLRILFVLLLASVLYFVIRKKEAVIDAAAKKHASVEQQLHLQAAALEAAANAIVITDCSGKILWVNRAFSELTGYTLEEALGNNPRILKSWEHDQTFYRTLWSTIQSGEVWHGEIRNRKKDGTLYTEEMTIAPVLTGGQITNFVGIKQDVTEKKKLEAQYRQAQKMEAVGRLGRRRGPRLQQCSQRDCRIHPALSRSLGRRSCGGKKPYAHQVGSGTGSVSDQAVAGVQQTTGCLSDRG